VRMDDVRYRADSRVDYLPIFIYHHLWKRSTARELMV